MTRAEAIKKVIEIISTQDSIGEAEEIAYQNDITITEVWDETDDEIIGMAVEDEVIYF